MKTLKTLFIFLSILTNILCLSLLGILFKIGDEKHKIEDSKEYYLKKIQCVKLESVVDSISYASQLGRLDTVTLLLTVFGIVLGFAAIFGFLGIKESSENVAKNAAEKWLEENADKIIKEITIRKEAFGFEGKNVDPIKNAKEAAKRAKRTAKTHDKKYENL